MMRYFLAAIAFVFCFALLAQASFAATAVPINPKEIGSATIRLAKSGTLTPTGSIQSASLSLYIAQEGQTNIEVSPSDWEYAADANGNKMVRIHFKNLNDPRAYSLVQVVKTSAQPLGADAALDSGSEYTAETSGAQITANISATAYPFPRTLAGVAGMASWVHGYLTYDRSVFGLNKPSDWVLASRRGVCVEYSNLLAAMLRSKGIAARYANGYAYSTEDNSLIGHEWIEVGLAASTESPAFGEHRDSCLGCSAAEPSGAWVGFDPTWLEGGFIDATHMKTSISKDGVEKETLSYLGNGDLDWQKNPESVELLNYSAGYSTAISIEAPQSLPLAGGGYVKATISYQGCTMAQLRVSSCTNQAGREILHVQGGTRNLWLCGSATAFWAFTTSLAGGYAYSCPVLAYDQSGAEAERTISISGGAAGQQPAISGPDSAGVNKPFTIQTSPGSRLFSTELGEGTSPWTLTLMEPGTYHFYAYANGQLAQKPVEVRSVEEFELTAAAPASVNQTRSFIISAALRNIGSSAKAVTLKAVFGNQTQEQQASIDAGQSQTFAFNLTAYDAGTIRYTISAMSDSYTGYSGVIDVIPAPPAPKGILDLILDALKGMMDWLAGLFGAK